MQDIPPELVFTIVQYLDLESKIKFQTAWPQLPLTKTDKIKCSILQRVLSYQYLFDNNLNRLYFKLEKDCVTISNLPPTNINRNVPAAPDCEAIKEKFHAESQCLKCHLDFKNNYTNKCTIGFKNDKQHIWVCGHIELQPGLRILTGSRICSIDPRYIADFENYINQFVNLACSLIK